MLEPKSYVESTSGIIFLDSVVAAKRLPVTLPIKLPVTVSIAAASACIFDHCNEEEPKSYVEFKEGTISLD